MPVFFIRHRTRYLYASPVIDSANQVKLYPLADDHQRILEHRLQVSQHPPVHTSTDYFGNTTGFFSLIVPHTELLIENLLTVEMLTKPAPKLTGRPKELWEQVRSEAVQLEYHDFLKAEVAACQFEVQQAIHEIMDRDQHPLDTVLELSDFIYKNFQYKKGVTNIETKVDEIWKLKAGVCQDFAHLLLYMLRLMGVPSRYISGYICPGSSHWRGEGATHAWAEVWLPDTGWVGVDPTNDCMAGERHVRLATGRNFSDCTPVKGTYKGASEHTLEVTVEFDTKPFTGGEQKAKPQAFVRQAEGAGVPRNSYLAYLQMQQQQQ